MQYYVETAQYFTDIKLASLFQVQEKLKACRDSKWNYSGSCFIENDSHVNIVWLHVVVFGEHDILHFWDNVLFRDGSRAAATSKMERFAIIVNSFQPLPIITKHSILNIASVLDPPLLCIYESIIQWRYLKTAFILSVAQIKQVCKFPSFRLH